MQSPPHDFRNRLSREMQGKPQVAAQAAREISKVSLENRAGNSVDGIKPGFEFGIKSDVLIEGSAGKKIQEKKEKRRDRPKREYSRENSSD